MTGPGLLCLVFSILTIGSVMSTNFGVVEVDAFWGFVIFGTLTIITFIWTIMYKTKHKLA